MALPPPATHRAPSEAGAPPATTPSPATAAQPAADAGRSPATGTIRLVVALFLLWSGFAAMASPVESAAARRTGVDVLQPLAALYFTVGVFLLSGFMTRVAGLLLAILAAWEASAVGANPVLVALALVGVYLMLRGSGAWAVDIYVQRMQDRVRRREAQQAGAREAGG